MVTRSLLAGFYGHANTIVAMDTYWMLIVYHMTWSLWVGYYTYWLESLLRILTVGSLAVSWEWLL